MAPPNSAGQPGSVPVAASCAAVTVSGAAAGSMPEVPVTVMVCEPPAVPAGIVTTFENVPAAEVVTLVSSTGVEFRVICSVAFGGNPDPETVS